MGKELKNAFLEAGFTDIQATLSFDSFGSAEDIAFLHSFIGGWFFMPEVVAAAIQYGLATQQIFDQVRVALDEWSEEAGAVGGLAFGECLASKP